ncbi:protein kinase [Paenibacillus sp. SC116]|uniref:protein kinase domain-containing protein n=1 Tax=Paenibacillus sp. SC116 TaxID=2968986 RepID=UPI00215ABD00|nr:protein kinase [Paenibacillus sp. SC116]MCR8844923.1 protein kinase [Paenibacillus sp. SC116]
MARTVDEEKNRIRVFIRENNHIETMLGSINLGLEIGQGGNALVYSATWGRGEVAVKILAEDSSLKKSTRYQRFITEVREIVKLSDTKAVVPIYYTSELLINGSKYPFMIMKKYPMTLNNWIKHNSINDIEKLTDVIKQLMYCLNIIHTHNIVHRDVKPQNILVDSEEQFILSDFGISWFDPEHYERLVKTEKNERLANFGFSAPEQFEKNPDPKPTMDLYALGQIIQWLVTGSTTRGVGRPLLGERESSFAVLDSLVDRLIQHDPQHRPQSISEMNQLLKEALTPPVYIESEEDRVIRVLRNFDKLIRLACPGKRGIIRITEPRKIEYIMNLLSNSSDMELWWTQGSSDCSINQEIRRLNEQTWIIDHGEHWIEEIWIKKDDSLDHHFVLLQCAPMESFGIYGDGSYRYEEAAWFKDRYITRQEYDDGVAEINGEVIELERSAELRTRELERDYLFIASKYNSIIVGKNRSRVDDVYHRLKNFELVSEGVLSNLNNLKKHPISLMMS